MTIREINKLPAAEQAVTRASYRYYRAVLQGASNAARQHLRGLWLLELQRRWPDTCK
ncbi:MAG: hypothetical protein IAF00_05690 [Phycisphaerales bacterium]|nr:hypothetical protein [Phycisphaerales bacterium]